MIRILFVCTGNICRSPTAEGVFRHLAGADSFEVDSAGTESFHTGAAPDSRAVAEAARRGVDISGQRARTLTREDFLRFDHIVAMDSGHLAAMKRMAPGGARARLSLFLGAADVPDPYYGTAEDFTQVYDLVQQGAKDLLHRLMQEAAA